MGLKDKKAIHVEYPQAVPLKYVIDPNNCIYLQKGKCGACKKLCPAGAIDFEQKQETLTLNVGAVIFSSGFNPFNPSALDSYRYDYRPNVITSMEMERILSASGPTGGHLVRLSDKKKPKKIAWLQCVGSRDMNRCGNPYCSSVCCMYAIKEAVVAKEHSEEGLDCAIFYMDIRTPGKEFEKFYNNAKEKEGVRFIKSRIHSIQDIVNSDDLRISYLDEDNKLQSEVFDMIVLSIGMEIDKNIVKLSQKIGINLSEGNFCKTSTFNPLETSRKGIFVSGAFGGPKDIPQSVVYASGAACAASEILSPARNTLAKKVEPIPETSVIGERPSIGVFICKCGSNIAGVVDVGKVVEYASKLPFVDYAAENIYSCSQDNQDGMAQLIKEKGLNRVVVAACTPKTHEPLFQETLTSAGLNKYLFEMANIRNHNSWVHKDTPELATLKAIDLVRMAVEKVAIAKPLSETELEVNQQALVIGGGIAGISAALGLASQGYDTYLVEKNNRLGGEANKIFKSANKENVQKELTSLITAAQNNDKLHIRLNSSIVNVKGFVGNFKTVIASDNKEETIEHGVSVIATGGTASKPSEYLYGEDERIITSLDLDEKFINNDKSLKKVKSAVFIQCVGSREPNRPYCSGVCCTHSIINALELKKINPDMNIFILYRDIRTYGEKEYLYHQAREAGIIFIRYLAIDKPNIKIENGKISVTVYDTSLNKYLEMEADLITLASAIIANQDQKLAKFFKIPVNEDGFYIEKHAKLGPCEFATDGVFLCGLAHYPKPIDESIAHGKGAAAKALTLLAKKKIRTSGTIADVEPLKCSSCGVCVSICPYSAPSFIPDDARFFAGKAQINPVLCKGCGLCVASCRSGALRLKGFDNDQIFAQISAAFEKAA